jgi:hypothetical protein
MREVHGHEGSALNNAVKITADDRDESGGSHFYTATVSEGGLEKWSCPLPPFQKGPLKETGLNGISDEVLLAIVIDRLEGFQTGPFKSRHNALAITNLEQGLMWLQKRTADRQNRGVEGTNQV